MGFGNKSRKEAKAQQEAAMRQQQAQYDAYMRQVNEYNNSFNTRNAGLIAMRDSASSWLNRFNKGEDVAKLNPAFAKNALAAAETTKKTMQFASKLGDNSTMGVRGDADYQAKLRSSAEADVSKGLAFQNMQGLQDELGNQRGILMDSTNVLNSDSRAGVGMSAEGFNMTNSIFNNATTKRQMEIARSQAMMSNFMGFLGMGVQAFGMAASGGMLGAAKAATGAVSGGGPAAAGTMGSGGIGAGWNYGNWQTGR